MPPITSPFGWNLLLLACLCLAAVLAVSAAGDPDPKTPPAPQTLPGTQPLTWDGDIASRMVDGVDRFLLRKIAQSAAGRERYWKRDHSSPEAYQRSVEPNRQALAHILGLRDARVPFRNLELAGTTAEPALVGRGQGFEAFAVRWPAFGDVHGEGLLLVPTGRKAVAHVVAVPDADQTPEQISGLAPGVPPAEQYARRLAESGCRVVVPVLIDRHVEARNGRVRLTSREFLYRPAYELGRQLIGYEVQKVLAAVDWFTVDSPGEPIGVMGWGEGGLLSFYAAAVDPRIRAACVSGYFDDRGNVWQEPLDRNVFGLLDQFGDAEIASLIAPRTLIVEPSRGPELVLPSEGGAPGRLVTPRLADVRSEVRRANQLSGSESTHWISEGEQPGPYGSPAALEAFLGALAPGAKAAAAGPEPEALRKDWHAAERQQRQQHEIDRHNQWLLAGSADVRREYMARLDSSSPEAYARTSAEYRRQFSEDVIGHFDDQPLPPNPRTRKAYETPKWTGYEVVLDLWDDVFAYGILLLPKGMRDGEKRPVVVCQHGLEGRPQDTVTGDSGYYHDFAARLADQGFITFAPQNLYLFTDRFRTLQRKANPLKKTLYSIITPQQQQILDWLKTLPHVDPHRMAFYGLSYGGKTAMRVPALLPDYCLSICSGDFNEWVWKNASTRSPYSYVWGNEYEIFEWDLGSTFNYAEMAALIAPRPFMVERGHMDGVAPDETVAYEFAKVRYLYEARLGLKDQCEIEWFTGPHTIHGVGTFAFLHKHLNWP